MSKEKHALKRQVEQTAYDRDPGYRPQLDTLIRTPVELLPHCPPHMTRMLCTSLYAEQMKAHVIERIQ